MPDTTIKKVEAGTSPRGEMGQKYLVAGKRVSMRLWVQRTRGQAQGPNSQGLRDRRVRNLGAAQSSIWKDKNSNLKAGDLWLVPAGAMHQYTIIEPFTAVEATAPPAEVHGRDAPA